MVYRFNLLVNKRSYHPFPRPACKNYSTLRQVKSEKWRTILFSHSLFFYLTNSIQKPRLSQKTTMKNGCVPIRWQESGAKLILGRKLISINPKKLIETSYGQHMDKKKELHHFFFVALIYRLTTETSKLMYRWIMVLGNNINMNCSTQYLITCKSATKLYPYANNRFTYVGKGELILVFNRQLHRWNLNQSKADQSG